MVSSISAGTIINDKLRNSEDLKKIIQDKIYPILPLQHAKYPFLTFNKETAHAVYTKDLILYDEVTFSFTAWANTYGQTCQILEAVREIFDCYRDRVIIHSELVDEAELAEEGIFALSIVFKFRIKPII